MNIISPSSVWIVPRTSSLNTPPGNIRPQSADGGNILPLIRGPSTHPVGTLKINRFASADWGGSKEAYRVMRNSVLSDVVGSPDPADSTRIRRKDEGPRLTR